VVALIIPASAPPSTISSMAAPSRDAGLGRAVVAASSLMSVSTTSPPGGTAGALVGRLVVRDRARSRSSRGSQGLRDHAERIFGFIR
jgi:hypothetical protein